VLANKQSAFLGGSALRLGRRPVVVDYLYVDLWFMTAMSPSLRPKSSIQGGPPGLLLLRSLNRRRRGAFLGWTISYYVLYRSTYNHKYAFVAQ
jgi:hypothetical protein